MPVASDELPEASDELPESSDALPDDIRWTPGAIRCTAGAIFCDVCPVTGKSVPKWDAPGADGDMVCVCKGPLSPSTHRSALREERPPSPWPSPQGEGTRSASLRLIGSFSACAAHCHHASSAAVSIGSPGARHAPPLLGERAGVRAGFNSETRRDGLTPGGVK